MTNGTCIGRSYYNETSSGQGFMLQGSVSDDICSYYSQNFICQGKFKTTYVKVSFIIYINSITSIQIFSALGAFLE